MHNTNYIYYKLYRYSYYYHHILKVHICLYYPVVSFLHVHFETWRIYFGTRKKAGKLLFSPFLSPRAGVWMTCTAEATTVTWHVTAGLPRNTFVSTSSPTSDDILTPGFILREAGSRLLGGPYLSEVQKAFFFRRVWLHCARRTLTWEKLQ